MAAVGGSIIYRGVVAAALQMGFAPTDLKLVTAIIVVAALAAPTLASAKTGSFWLRKRQAGGEAK
jgi:putative ABC transport system permease protein